MLYRRLVLLLVFAAGCASAQKLPASPQPLRLGAAWYPEQWPEAQWESDLQLMQNAHMNVVRIGEFAWSSLEPSEGHYELDWMARAIALAAKHHIAVVIGTPTDAPPAWLTSKYPDTLGMNADGRLREHGGRRQFNYASPRYRRLCTLIVTQLAQRFGHNPNVIGWQIGNEFTDESFDPATRAFFQQFLREKYKTLANLNRQWATAYWSQTYTAWSQIPIENTGGNPGLLLEHKHFVTATWRSFQRVQIDALRPLVLPTQFITTNIGGLGWSDNWDHYAITSDLDLASWDDYVGEGHLDVSKNAMLNDFARGWKRQNFWVMETEPGSVNWAPVNNSLWPGETRALAWQTIGHGADAVLYWQWRDALNGQEQYHGAIVGADGKPNPIYSEIAELGHDLELTRDVLDGTSPHAEIAILHDYDSRWAIDFQPHTKDYDQQKVLLRFYEPLERMAQASGHSVDIIDPNTAPLNQYKLLVAPSLNVISGGLAAKLLDYVRGGGYLLLGPRSGMKDEYNSLNPERQPGPLAKALGAKVEQYYALDAPKSLVYAGAIHGEAHPWDPAVGSADTWAESIQLLQPEVGMQIEKGAFPAGMDPRLNPDVVVRYRDPGGWLDRKPAMVEKSVGSGVLSYLGTLPDPAFLAKVLTSPALRERISSSPRPIPPGVELCVRSAGTGAQSRTVDILINHGKETVEVEMSGTFFNLLPADQAAPAIMQLPPTPGLTTKISLVPQGVAVLIPEPAR